MNKILLTIILLTHTNNVLSHKSFERFTLTQKESEFLTSLKENYLEDRLSLKKMSNDNLNLSLDLLSKQIQLLSEEPLSKKSWMLSLSGLIPLSIGIYFTISPIQALYKLHDKFIAGKFKVIHVPFSIIKKLPSTIIRKEEREYLQRFSFEDILFTYKKDPFFRERFWDQTGNIITITQKDMVNNTIARLSPIEKEKIIYHALYSAITHLKFKAFEKFFGILFAMTMGMSSSFPFFKEAFASDLKTTKKLYNFLKREHTRRSKCLCVY